MEFARRRSRTITLCVTFLTSIGIASVSLSCSQGGERGRASGRDGSTPSSLVLIATTSSLERCIVRISSSGVLLEQRDFPEDGRLRGLRTSQDRIILIHLHDTFHPSLMTSINPIDFSMETPLADLGEIGYVRGGRDETLIRLGEAPELLAVMSRHWNVLPTGSGQPNYSLLIVNTRAGTKRGIPVPGKFETLTAVSNSEAVTIANAIHSPVADTWPTSEEQRGAVIMADPMYGLHVVGTACPGLDLLIDSHPSTTEHDGVSSPIVFTHLRGQALRWWDKRGGVFEWEEATGAMARVLQIGPPLLPEDVGGSRVDFSSSVDAYVTAKEAGPPGDTVTYIVKVSGDLQSMTILDSKPGSCVDMMLQDGVCLYAVLNGSRLTVHRVDLSTGGGSFQWEVPSEFHASLYDGFHLIGEF